MVDSNTVNPNFVDPTPVSQPGNWSSTINCSIKPTINLFNLTRPDGTPTDNMVHGYNYAYDENNNYIALPYDIWVYYYYPNDSIVFYANVSQWNYALNISVQTDGLSNYSAEIENMTGPFGADGLYKFNITFNSSDLNMSNPYVSMKPSSIDLDVVYFDNAGNSNMTEIVAQYNFTPSQVYTELGGDTTDWSTIPDFTNVTNLTFEVPGVAKIKFTEGTDLTDMDFIHGLRNLADNFIIGDGSVFINSSALAALNKSATVWMYNLPFDETPGLLMNGQPVVLTNGASFTISDHSTINDFQWNATTKTLRFNVTHWSEYDADGTPPKLTITVSPATIYVGTDVDIVCTANEKTSSKNVTITDPEGNVYDLSEFTSPKKAGTYNVTCTAKDLVGLESTKTVTFTAKRRSSGGGGHYVPPIMQSFLIVDSKSGQHYKVNFTNENLSIVSMEFVSKGGNCEVGAERLRKRPNVPETGMNEYAYFDFTGKNVENVTIRFKVSKSWMEQNNIDPNSIVLERYHNEWIKLTTRMVGSDDKFYYYEATTPGFSYFIVGGTTKSSEEEVSDCRTKGCPSGEECKEVDNEYKCIEENNQTSSACGNGVCDQGENCENCASDCACNASSTCNNGTCVPKQEPHSSSQSNHTLAYILAAVIGIIIVVAGIKLLA